MRAIDVCVRCGMPWARHVARCPGCGRERHSALRVILQLVVVAWLASLLWR